MKKYKRVFLSIKNVPIEEVQKLIDQLVGLGYDVKTSDLEGKLEILIETNEDEEYIIKEIEWCDIVFVLIGSGENENVCVNKEIEECSNQEKQVIGIYVGGGTESVPSALENCGDGLIANDIKKIISALEGNQVPWEEPSGSIRSPKNTIDTGDC